MDKKKSTGILLSVLGVLSLVLITAGVTYAFFAYTKQGTTENTITTGTITFLYDELAAEGNGVKITDAMPMSDADGKVLTGPNNVFNFKVTATTTGKSDIPYEVTARMKAGSTEALASKVKLYLTTVGSSSDETAAPLTVNGDKVKLFTDLKQTSKVTTDIADERTIYVGNVPAGSSDYSQSFNLRMWLSGDEGESELDFSPLEFKNKNDQTLITSTAYYALTAEEQANYERIAYVNNETKTALTAAEYEALDTSARDGYVAGEQLYLYSNQSFAVTVNVYANATVVSAGQ